MKFYTIIEQMNSFKTMLEILNLKTIKQIPYTGIDMILEFRDSVYVFKKTFQVDEKPVPQNNIVSKGTILIGSPLTVNAPTAVPVPSQKNYEIVFKFTDSSLVSISIQYPNILYMLSQPELNKPKHYIYFCGQNLIYNNTIMSACGETETLFHSDIMNEEINLSSLIEFRKEIDEILEKKVL